MRIGLVDVDAWSRGKSTYPNIPLMKISAYHKSKGDSVEWYNPMCGRFDIVYLSKVFGDEYSRDYPYPINADEVIKGGSGYALSVVDGQEVYDITKDKSLPYEIDHTFPDYSLYGITDTAYGFLTKGCPRGCTFCHTGKMQGRISRTIAELKEFWNGQKNIVLFDPNITANRECVKHFNSISETGSYVDFSQGLDIRLLNEDKIDALNRVKYKNIHFAWDNPEEDLRDAFLFAKERLRNWNRECVSAYVLTNYGGGTIDDAIRRVMFLRSLNVRPYVMIYRKSTASHELKKLSRWVNNPYVFWSVATFDEYDASVKKKNNHQNLLQEEQEQQSLF